MTKRSTDCFNLFPPHDITGTLWEDHLEDELREDMLPELSVRGRHVLFGGLAVKTVGNFLALEFKKVTDAPNSGEKTWHELHELRERVFAEGPGKRMCPSPSEQKTKREKQLDWFTPDLENSTWADHLDRELRKEFLPSASTKVAITLFDKLRVQTFRDFFAQNVESISKVLRHGRTTWKSINDLQKAVFKEGPAPWFRAPSAIPVPGLSDATAFSSLSEMVLKAVELVDGLTEQKTTVLKLYLGLLNEEKNYTLVETGKSLGVTKQSIQIISDSICRKLFSPRILPIDDVFICVRALFKENGWKLSGQALVAGVDQTFGWTGTTAFSIRRLIEECCKKDESLKIELIDLPGGQGIGWNEDGSLNSEPSTEAAFLSALRKKAVRTILEEAGPQGLTKEEIVLKVNRRFSKADLGPGSLQHMIDGRSELDPDNPGVRIIHWERGVKSGTQTRFTLNTFFQDEKTMQVLQGAADSFRKHMEHTGLGIVGIWKTWKVFHNQFPVEIPELGFYALLRDANAGGLVYPDYPRVFYPGIKVSEKAFWWELYEYCALCERETATNSELRTFLVDSLWLEPQRASQTLSDMNLERDGEGRLVILSPDGRPVKCSFDGGVNMPNVFLPAIANFRDFSLARPRLPAGVLPSEVDADGRALKHGVYVKLFLARLEESGFSFSREERTGLEDSRWCQMNLGIDRAMFRPAEGLAKPDRSAYWNQKFRFGDHEYFVSDGWGPRSKAKFDIWAARIARQAGIPFEPYDVP